MRHCVRIENSSITISAAATVAAVPTRYRHGTIAIILATISRLELAGIAVLLYMLVIYIICSI